MKSLSWEANLSESASTTFSMQWSTHSHRSTHQWIDSATRSHATSESATMTSTLNAMIYSLTSFYLSVNLIKCSRATSESASMTWSSSITSKSMSLFMYQISTNSWACFYIETLSESASMTRSIVSLLQKQITIDLIDRVSHSIVSLLERHSKWVCYKDRQWLISWLSRSMNETSSTM